MIILLMVLLFVFLLGAVPIVFAMAFSASLAMLAATDISPAIMVQRFFAGIDRFSLMAMPFFIFAADVMSAGGISRILLDWVRA